MSDEMNVKLTLRKHVAEKLRQMCHARGLTASLLIEEWIFKADAQGRHPSVSVNPRETDFAQMVKDAMAKAKR